MKALDSTCCVLEFVLVDRMTATLGHLKMENELNDFKRNKPPKMHLPYNVTEGDARLHVEDRWFLR